MGTLLCVAGVAAPATAQDLAATGNAGIDGASPAGYVVVFKDGAQPDVAAKYGVRMRQRYDHALNGAFIEGSEEQVRRLAADPAVRMVERNTVVRQAPSRRATQPVPLSCGLDRIDQRALPLDGSYSYPRSAAQGVDVYLIGTGIDYTHPDLRLRAKAGFDAFGGGGIDGNGDGTHVAGVVGGEKFGVAKKAGLISVKVLDDQGGGTLAGVVGGIDWVTAHAKKPSVANFVIGYYLNDVLEEAVRRSIASGVTYVLSAGASSTDVAGTSPARVSEAITVGASDCADHVASFSNYGQGLDLYAPGVDITSDWSGGGTSAMSGTEVSAAFATGVVALYLAGHPWAAPRDVARALDCAAVKGALTGVPTDQTPNKLLQVVR